tara:strand:+ start:3466 stop:4305 length:840 start_codon:yes stop_codon:yes gene_type:complete
MEDIQQNTKSFQNQVSPIHKKFLELKSKDKFAFMPFLMAGDPSLEKTSHILLELQKKGADIIELGIPHSDPLADGPVIQLAASKAIKSGTSIEKVFDMLRGLKDKLHTPVVIFTYCNPLLSFGFERFCKEAQLVNVCGLVIPDLPLEEADIFSEVAKSYFIDLVLLVAPTTPRERMIKISQKSRGFLYLVSVTGVTGERELIEDRVQRLLYELKEITSIPIVVGFGISSPKHVLKVRSWGANGVIVGSALVKRITNIEESKVVNEAGRLCEEFNQAAKQ